MTKAHFDKLLQLYFDRTITPQQEAELMEAIATGKYNNIIDDKIDASEAPSIHTPSQEQLNKEIASLLTKATARDTEKVIPLFEQPYKRRWLSAAAVLVFAVAGAWIIIQLTTSKPTNNTAATPEDTIHHYAGKQFIELPDGSTAILNDGSTLKYYNSYGKHRREVSLTGEAYFAVKPDKHHPFLVRAGSVSTEVLGTAFNVNAYPDNKNIVVTVSHGKVQLYDGAQKLDAITADQQLAVNTTTHQVTKKKVKTATVLAWQQKFLILDRVTMEEAIDTISKKYNIKISITNDAIKGCRVTARFLHNEKPADILTALSSTANAQCTISRDGTLVITGKGCP